MENMQKHTRKLRVICAAALASLGTITAAHAVTIDGTLSPGEGYNLVSTQTNTTTSQSSDGGGTGGPDDQATLNSTGNFTNISNAYAQIDTSANALDLFLGGSMEEDNDSKYDIALQLNSHGVTSLAGITVNGAASSTSLDKVMFNNFKPTALFVVFPGQPTSSGILNFSSTVNTTPGIYGGVSYTDLTGVGYAAPASVTATLNNALVTTPVGTGAPGDPGFVGANTGLEISIPLATLGYTPGDSINALVFPSVGKDGRTNNQILAPFTYGTDTNYYDYTYIDSTNSSSGSQVGRQFVDSVYPGTGFFTVSVPEPTSVALLGFAGLALLNRRTRKA
jgi:hypothetical protein